MKKFLSLFLLLFVSYTLFAQLDREHWFAPMIDRTGLTNNPALPAAQQKVYLSTNRTTPFPVSIYNNNVLITTVNISKGNPQKVDIPRNLIIATQQTDLFTPTNKGLYIKGEFPFFANLRFSVYNHAEIITSKGLASIGNNFYAAMAPISASNSILNFMTSVLATEDNTHVTISGYQSTVQFSNGTTGATTPTIAFTLNKGQSYILDGKGDVTGNTNGFIGAKITSDKPVNITNGNFNGQYATSVLTSSDILMDQAVPVNQLGSEFALVKGNGNIGSNMEGAIVVATVNNTEVRVNNELTPLAVLNAGQYYVIPDTKYIDQGNGHFNLLIKTSSNAYVYQILAGNSAGSEATGGFNFIPALTCYLPKTIDEIGLIDENFVYSNGNPNGLLNIPTKLNLITETGASVLVNGNPPPAGTGPFPMLGTPNWVTYGIANISGNITVSSTKAITAGITAGSDAVGYGGFFAGFYTMPVIVKSGGNCVPGIVLTVDPTNYDTYQWLRNGTVIVGATNPSYTPTQSGDYTCRVTMGTCAPLVTAPFRVLNCVKLSNANLNICLPQQTFQNITPSLSASSQTVLPSTVSIVTPPTQGTAVINPTTGIITYTPNAGAASGTDSFVYTFCGNDANFPDCETVTVNIQWQTITTINTTLTVCPNQDGTGTFNLTTANIVGGNTTLPRNITYYPTLLDAQNENTAAVIAPATSYIANGGSIVYAVVKTNLGCKSIAQITLNVYQTANVIDFTGTFCDENFDGTIEILLSSLTTQIVTNTGNFQIRYYANLPDATAGSANTLANTYSFTANVTIYIRVDSADGCPAIIKPVHLKIGDRIPLLNSQSQQSICDDDFDGITQLNLSSVIIAFTTDLSVSGAFFSTLADAQNNTGSLGNVVTVQGTQTFYIRFTKNGVCSQIGKLIVTVKTPKKSDILKNVSICPNATTTLDAGPGFDSYLWSTGATTSSITNVGPGTYWVDLTFNGCVYRQTVTVTAAPIPIITAIEITDGTVTIIVSGGTPPYEYSIDGISWQTSNIFTNVPSGNHVAYVRDSLKCSTIEKPFSIVKRVNAITPNEDGHNDVIDYSTLMLKEDPEFRVFDRYGAEIFKGDRSNGFIWNGKMGGKPVPTATYWYILKWREIGSPTIITYSSWLLVKNRADKHEYHPGAK